MKKTVQLDKKRIEKELNAAKGAYPLLKPMQTIAGLTLQICVLWLLIDVLRLMGAMPGDGPCFSIFIMAGLTLFLLFLKKMKKSAISRYESTFKRLMAEPILKASLEHVTYSPNHGFTKSEVKKMHLLYAPLDNHFESEDMMEGEHMGVTFKQSDILISHYNHDNDDSKRNVPTDRDGREIDVDGRLTRFPFKTEISGIIQIATDSGFSRKKINGRSLFEVEDINFNKHYNVYADDAHSVFYALTPQVIDYFNSLRIVTKEFVSVTLDGEYLYILRNGNGGIFKADIEKPFDPEAKERQIYNEIAEIEKLIKVFHLRQRETKTH